MGNNITKYYIPNIYLFIFTMVLQQVKCHRKACHLRIIPPPPPKKKNTLLSHCCHITYFVFQNCTAPFLEAMIRIQLQTFHFHPFNSRHIIISNPSSGSIPCMHIVSPLQMSLYLSHIIFYIIIQAIYKMVYAYQNKQ